jgi:formate dehydrogenase maturation protein FdhE
MAPISSRKLDILPLRRAVKKESGTHIKVWREVENLKRKEKKSYCPTCGTMALNSTISKY